MFETAFTIVGNVVTDPIHRRVGDQEIADVVRDVERVDVLQQSLQLAEHVLARTSA